MISFRRITKARWCEPATKLGGCATVCARKGNLPADASSRSPEEQLSLLTIASKLFEYRWADERIQTEFDLYAELD